MLTYDLQQRGQLPLYDYLYRCLRGDILQGKLPAGTRLPSKRTLAEHLQVSVSTVETAYAQLITEGYVLPVEKRGYFVAAVEPAPPRAAAAAAERPPARSEPPRDWLLDLTAGAVRPELFPFSVWSGLMRKTLSEQHARLLQPIPYNGVAALREAICAHLRSFRGMEVQPEQIILGAGTEYLYGLIVQLLGQGRVYAVENPGHRKTGQVYAACGARVMPVALDRQGISMEGLRRSGASVCHISPSHHYPTGLVTPISRRQALLQWAEAGPERYLIEDDYDSEFRFSGKPIPTLQSIDHSGRVLYINTFSKTIAPSIRIGYLVLPPLLLERFRQRLGFLACTVPAFEQYTLARFLSEGHFERHLRRVRTYYRGLRTAVTDAISASALRPFLAPVSAGAGLHFLLRLRTGRPDSEIKTLAAEAGVRVSFLTDYLSGPLPGCEHQLVISYASVDPARLPEAIRRLEAVFSAL